MPDYFVFHKDGSWFAKRNRHKSEKPKGEVFNIIAKTKSRAIASARKIVEDIEKMQVEATSSVAEARGSTVSKSTEVKTEQDK